MDDDYEIYRDEAGNDVAPDSPELYEWEVSRGGLRRVGIGPAHPDYPRD